MSWGYAYAAPFRPREGYRFTVEDSIYVREDCKGYGVGKKLLTELISVCQAKSCHSMIACVCGINVPSVALHSSLGFLPRNNTGGGEEIRGMAESFDYAASPPASGGEGMPKRFYRYQPDLAEVPHLRTVQLLRPRELGVHWTPLSTSSGLRQGRCGPRRSYSREGRVEGHPE